MKGDESKIYDLNEAREKISSYCAYRDRSQKEVREKLEAYGLIAEAVDQILTELIQDKFLDEERFARSFVRGKFNIKKWGRIKIEQALYPHHLSDYVKRKAFSEIDEEKYLHTLKEVVRKKAKYIKAPSLFQKRGKLAHYAISRGFEPDLVWEEVYRQLPDK